MVRLRKPTLEEADAIVACSKNKNFLIYVGYLNSLRDEYFAVLARGLATETGAVDQREIDEKRGFWSHPKFISEKLPRLAAGLLKRDLDEATKEAGQLA